MFALRLAVAGVVCAVLVVVLPVSAAFGQNSHVDEPLFRPHEMPPFDLPAMFREPPVTSPPMRVRSGGYTSVQVNVDALGDNIVGDAANEPTLAVDPTNPDRMVICWRQFDTIVSNFRQAGYAYSHDGGLTWNAGVLDPGVFRSDPVLATDADGNIYFYSLEEDFTCDMFISSDGGVTWTAPIPAPGGDKEWMAIDRTDGVGRGNIYGAWTGSAGFTRSTDGGLTYMTPIAIPDTPSWRTLDVGPDGSLYIAGWDWDQGFVVIRSINAQNSLEAPTFDLTEHFDMGGYMPYSVGPNPGGLLGQPWVVSDHSGGQYDGNLYVLGVVSPNLYDDPADVVVARSTDRGQTWSSAVRVNDDRLENGAWQWFGAISVAPDGRLDVAWYDTRRTGKSNWSEVYYAYSTDAGATWSGNMVVTPLFDSHVGWPNQNKIGDYIHMSSLESHAKLAYAATFNGEEDVYYVELGDCNGNGVHDAVDLANGTVPDIDGNNTPDTCEPDCNNNGLPDAFDIEISVSLDCNANGTPDECDIADGVSGDANGNGVPDECETCLITPFSGIWPTSLYSTHMGQSVDLYGDVAVVGAPYDRDLGTEAGAVYVTRLIDSTWEIEAKLTAAETVANSRFGADVAIDGEVIVVGASLADDIGEDAGAAYVFRYVNGGWVEEASLYADDGAAGDLFGKSVAMLGNRIVIGAFQHDYAGNDAGAAYLFEWDGQAWTQVAKIIGSEVTAGHQFGYDVALDEDVIVIGARYDTALGLNAGAVYVFRRNVDGVWQEEAILRGTDTNANDAFGDAVAVSGNLVVIGASQANDLSGLVYVFQYAGGEWIEQARFDPPAPVETNLRFGQSVAIDGATILIGEPGRKDSGYVVGTARLMRGAGGQWVRAGKLIPYEQHKSGEFGGSVVLRGEIALVGSPLLGSRGAVYDYRGIADCNSNGITDYCDIGNGVSVDCNVNGIPDQCDLAEGTSEDCNSNNIPDECEPDCDADGVPDACEIADCGPDDPSCDDCNANGVPDECDIAAGTSADCNANGIPDECDIADCPAYHPPSCGDCNANGVPDECDIAAGTSADCNGNNIPDECDVRPDFSDERIITTALFGARSVFSADLDQDGDADVLSASRGDHRIAWYENTDGLGAFGALDTITYSADGASCVFAADLDGDGDSDVLSASSDDNKIAWYENFPEFGTFGSQRVITRATDGAVSVFAIDIDGDGDNDVLSASLDDDKIAWYENTDGLGTFGAQQVITTSADGAYCVFSADMDGDGDADVLSASWYDDKIAWYENTDGQGTFGPQGIITIAANGAVSVYAADLDGDGDVDVLSASDQDDRICWYENVDGLGRFEPQQVHVINADADGAKSVIAMDMDGDGDADVLSASYWDDTIAWYENIDGLGTFGPQQDINHSVDGATSVFAADLDGDGDVDVLAVSSEDNKIAWYENISKDCNGNGVPDKCDLAGNDCDTNGVPDECDVADSANDCNANGVPDACDIENGTSSDYNSDGIPDECAPAGRGDLNCDAVIDLFDIDAFALALSDPTGYADAYSDCDRMLADVNGDGVVDLFDIDPFVILVSNHGWAVGDLNCDGAVDLFDIHPFALAVSQPYGYAAAFPYCNRLLADVNGDGSVDMFDIDPFVELLSGR